MRLRVVAPAKINWMLEVLRRRADGFHDIATVFQTVSLCDEVALEEAGRLSLELAGATGDLAREDVEGNLAMLAARALQDAIGARRGARIRLSKAIPTSAGMGGGSSDAAAVLRGLNRLWNIGMPVEEMMPLAAGLGSDVPFFLAGGTALGEGRGEVLTRLADGKGQRTIVVWPEQSVQGKTGRMYGELTADDWTDGSATRALAERLSQGLPVRDEDVVNVFEAALSRVLPEVAETMRRIAAEGLGIPHLCGSGGAFFMLAREGEDLSGPLARLREMGLSVVEARTLMAAEATVVEVEP